MALPSKFRAAIALLVAPCLLCPPALALVTFNDGKEHIYVTGTASVGYDSNIFARAGGAGDTTYAASVLVDYSRRAGWIGVNASVGLNLSQFVDNHDQNSVDPRFTVELSKSSGRTTGDISLSAIRENRADSAANIREQSWNYDLGVRAKYPVIERYSLSGNLGYSSRVYDENQQLSNLKTYLAGLDLNYALNSERDLVAGYQYRYSETSRDTAYDDQSFTVGVSGKIIPRLNGSVRMGYQVRNPHGRTTDGGYHGLTALGAATYTFSRKLSLTGQVSRDVSVTATDLSIDSLSATLSGQYTFNARFSAYANVGGGNSKFLGAAGGNRRDEYFTFGGGVNYTMKEHLKATLGYVYYQNWSTFSIAEYDRNTLTLSLTSRW